MTLRKKILLIIIVTLVCTFVLLYTTTGYIFINSVTRAEGKEIIKHMGRLQNTMNSQLTNLAHNAVEWVAWDETYAFMAGENDSYIEDSLMDSTFTTFGLNMVLFVSSSGELVFGKAFDLESKEETLLPTGLDAHLSAGSPFFTHTSAESVTTGIVNFDQDPMFIVSRPVLTSLQSGPPRGTLIMGRFLNQAEIRRLSSLLRFPFSIWQINGVLPSGPENAAANLSEANRYYIERIGGNNLIAGYTYMEDIYGHPAILMGIEIPRDIYTVIRSATNNMFISILVIGMMLSFVILIFLEKTVLSKLEKLSTMVRNVGESGDVSQRLKNTGSRDELYDLAANINLMLERLEQSKLVITQREGSLRLITDNMLDTISHVDMDGMIRYVSPSHKLVLGYDSEDMVGKQFFDFVHPSDLSTTEESFREGALTLAPHRWEFRFRDAAGHYIWMEGIGRVYYDDDGQPAGGVISCRDIGERKEMEEQLKYLSLYDSLTGLYNRTYFEREMERLKKSRLKHLSLIICDVDGLKLYNDSFGHSTGDTILQVAADVIRSCFREGDTVARIGGDEFAILLPDSREEEAERACRRIDEALQKHNDTKPKLPLSISMGFAVSHDMRNTDLLFKEADNNMYRKKLHSSKSARSATVQILMKALEARDYITEGHADRLQKLVVTLAGVAGVPEHRTTDLKLFAQFHDIGKVGTPDRILFKKGRLSLSDAAEMRRHCEVGHRIALSAPDLVPIADWILKHHEWWDGQGYPFGLKEEEIPLECRILAIADAYDAMTTDRPYRKATSHEKAMEEIKRFAGTQFDPVLVELFVKVVEEKGLGEA